MFGKFRKGVEKFIKIAGQTCIKWMLSIFLKFIGIVNSLNHAREIFNTFKVERAINLICEIIKWHKWNFEDI